MRSQKIIPNHNDLFVGISIESVIGLLVVNNTLEDRLISISKKELVQHYLGIDVPIFIQNLEVGFVEYTFEEQLKDIFKAEIIGSNSDAYRLASAISGEYKQPGTIELGFLWEIDPATVQISILSERDDEIEMQSLDGRLDIEDYKNFITNNLELILTYINNESNVIHYFPLVENLIEHLSNASKLDILREDALLLLFETLVNRKSEIFLPTIALVMEKMQGISIPSAPKLIGYNYVRTSMYVAWHDDYDERETVNAVNAPYWSILMTGLLNHNTQEMARWVVSYFPDYLNATITALRDIEKMLTNTLPNKNDKHIYKIEDIKKARLNLLLEIPNDLTYKGSKLDKEDLQNYFQEKIKAANDLEALEQIKREVSSCKLIRQKRNPNYDKVCSLFFDKIVSTVKILNDAITQRSVELNNSVENNPSIISQ